MHPSAVTSPPPPNTPGLQSLCEHTTHQCNHCVNTDTSPPSIHPPHTHTEVLQTPPISEGAPPRDAPQTTPNMWFTKCAVAVAPKCGCTTNRQQTLVTCVLTHSHTSVDRHITHHTCVYTQPPHMPLHPPPRATVSSPCIPTCSFRLKQ